MGGRRKEDSVKNEIGHKIRREREKKREGERERERERGAKKCKLFFCTFYLFSHSKTNKS